MRHTIIAESTNSIQQGLSLKAVGKRTGEMAPDAEYECLVRP